MSVALNPSMAARPRVGVPIGEAFLTAAVDEHPSAVLRPGTGRRLFVISEAPFAHGRPDIVVVAASAAGIESLRKRGLRLSNFTEARVLGGLADTTRDAGLSPEHVRSVTRRLKRSGWSAADAQRSATLVADSILVEAKQYDWRGGLAQLLRNRNYVHRVGLLVRTEAAGRADIALLERHRVGLFEFDSENEAVTNTVLAPTTHMSVSGALWLAELAARSLDG